MMKKETIAQKCLCAIWVFVGVSILAFGIVMLLQSGIGADPFTMFEEGLAKTLGVETGHAVLGTNLILLVLVFIFNHHYLGWGSLIISFCLGPWVTLFTNLGIVPIPHDFFSGLCLHLLGIVVVGFGIAIYMLPGWGVGGVEGLMICLSDRFKKPYVIIRVMMDSVWFILGFILGGTWGLGSVLGAFGIGIALDFFYKILFRIVGLKVKDTQIYPATNQQ